MLKKFKSIANLQSNTPSGSTGLTEKQIMAGFEGLDRKICLAVKTQGHIRIVCSGGACAVVLLKSRPSTKDVDFFTPNPDESREVTYARLELDRDENFKNYRTGWINCEMLAFANLSGSDTLFKNSLDMGETLFIGQKLIVYAADWKFQFVGKVCRAFNTLEEEQSERGVAGVGDPQSFLESDKDFKDALSFLHHMLGSRSKSSLSLSQVKSWYYYGHFINSGMVERVNTAYYRRYGVANAIAI